jgi:DNA-binding NtrC family response regulator
MDGANGRKGTWPPTDAAGLESRIVGRSREMRRVRALIRRVAESDVPVLIQGESGTGKELVARAVHDLGRRAGGRFVAVNCGAIPETLLESELFGHGRGAFTGALRERPGLVEEAEGGTFFLDEAGDLSPALQGKLLRLVQEREFRRVGENRTRRADVRFLSATHRDLAAEIVRGRFREDLFYRLAVVTIDVPPLRSRDEDLPVLLDHFLASCCRALGRATARFTAEAEALLGEYSWPGNVRELHNEVQRCLALAPPGAPIGEESLSDRIRRPAGERDGDGFNYFAARAGFERRFLRQALSRYGFNKTRTAGEIGLSRQGLFKLLRRHNLS